MKKMENNLERRMTTHEIECRASEDNSEYIVRGYGAVFNSPTIIRSKMGVFSEEISERAFDDVLTGQDVVFTYNHDPSNILARSSSGTLTYGTDEVGLWYRASIPNTTLGNDMKELIKRGDINANSFAFAVHRDDITTSQRGGLRHVRVEKITKLADISLVTIPAYKDAVVLSRSSDAYGLDEQKKRPRISRSTLLKRRVYKSKF